MTEGRLYTPLPILCHLASQAAVMGDSLLLDHITLRVRLCEREVVRFRSAKSQKAFVIIERRIQVMVMKHLEERDEIKKKEELWVKIYLQYWTL